MVDPVPVNHRSGLWFWPLWTLTTAGMAVAIGLVFLYVPDERVMGAVQRIFYFHVPAAIVAFFGVFLLLAGSIGYLWTRDRRWDHLALASTEVALLFCTIVLVTGPLWAKPAWGVWWTWEAKITTTLILWLLLLGCLMVRRYAESPEVGARLASILGIFSAADVYIIYKATVWWRGQHPVVFAPDKEGGLAPKMMHALLTCMPVFFLLFALLIFVRYRLACLEDRAEAVLDRALEN